MSFNRPNTPANINYSNWDINNNGVEGHDVVIIGAGLSGRMSFTWIDQVLIEQCSFVGLYAASVLMENGVDNFVVLEARDRAGGRTFTKKVSFISAIEWH